MLLGLLLLGGGHGAGHVLAGDLVGPHLGGHGHDAGVALVRRVVGRARFGDRVGVCVAGLDFETKLFLNEGDGFLQGHGDFRGWG